MGLQEQLDAFKSEFARTAPPGRPALYEAKIEELRASFAIEEAMGIGDEAPDFSLTDARGKPVSLSDLLRSGSVVVTFYRGGWCPYCNIQLRAYQAILPQLAALGARLVAISPQLPDASLGTAETNALTFDVLSDVGNVVARRFGLVYALPEELRAALRSNNKALPTVNGDESWELPVPATYVIAPDGRVALAHIEVDYRKRLEPEAILTALKSLKPA
jgi:peroxiredoxin